MNNGKTISFKRVLYRAMSHPNAEDLSEEQAATYSFELIRTLGIPLSFGETTKFLKVVNNRASIPKNLIYINGVRYHIDDSTTSSTTENEFYINSDLQSYLSTLTNWIPAKYSGDIYHSSFHCEDYRDNSYNTQITYTINNNYVYLSEKNGNIEISYRELLTDKEGYPLIPDNQSFENALYYYMLKEHFFPLVGLGKITQYFYEKIEQEYAFYAGQADNSLKLSGLDHWETTMNGIRRLIQYQNLSDYGFKELSNREQIRKSL